MPHHCWKTATTIPINKTTRNFGLKRALKSTFSDISSRVALIPAISSRAYSSPPILFNVGNAFSGFPAFINQRELSGSINTSAKKYRRWHSTGKKHPAPPDLTIPRSTNKFIGCPDRNFFGNNQVDDLSSEYSYYYCQ